MGAGSKKKNSILSACTLNCLTKEQSSIKWCVLRQGRLGKIIKDDFLCLSFQLIARTRTSFLARSIQHHHLPSRCHSRLYSTLLLHLNRLLAKALVVQHPFRQQTLLVEYCERTHQQVRLSYLQNDSLLPK